MSTERTLPRTAAELHARSLGKKCEGQFECHWCGASCTREFIHDDPPPTPFMRNTYTAKRPSNPYVCKGCLLYRRPRVSVRTMNGSMLDRKCMKDHGWWMDEESTRIILPDEANFVYEKLLYPPFVFAVALKGALNSPTMIQHAELNVNEEINASTPLKFTVDNVPHAYTIHELVSALKHGTEGRMPGVRLLVMLLGEYPLPDDEKRPRGRPRRESSEQTPAQKTIRKAA